MDLHGALRRIGLNQKQQMVYLAALELGRSSITELAKKSNLKRPTTYNIVEELQIRGLLGMTTIGKRSVYSPTHPRRLLEIARAAEKEMEESLPELLALYNTPSEKPRVQVFEGPEGVMTVYKELYDSLSKNEEALWITRIGALEQVMPKALEYYKKMLQRLKQAHIKELDFGDSAGKKWALEIKPYQSKHHFVRLLSTDHEYGFTDNLIYGNKLAIFSLKTRIFVIVIQSEDIAKTYRALFEHAWKQGVEV